MGKIIDIRRQMGGKPLPYDTEVEYLESTGTQYIDTGIKPQGNEETVIVFNFVGYSSQNYGAVFGCQESSSSMRFYAGYASGGRGVHAALGTGISYAVTTFAKASNKGTLKLNTATGIVQWDTSSRNAGTFQQNDLNIFIYGCNTNGSITGRTRIKLYSINFGSRMLLIPVRVGTTGYLYDKVSGQLFGNSGEGEFILGPDVMGGVILELVMPALGERRAA